MNTTQAVILEELGLQDASPELQTEALAKMAELIQNRSMIRVSEILTDEQVQELSDLADGDDPEQVYAFLQHNVPTYNLIVQEETRKLRNDLKDNMDAINAKLAATVVEVDRSQAN